MLVDVIGVLWHVKDVLLCRRVKNDETSRRSDHDIEHFDELFVRLTVRQGAELLCEDASLSGLLVEEGLRDTHNEANGSVKSRLHSNLWLFFNYYFLLNLRARPRSLSKVCIHCWTHVFHEVEHVGFLPFLLDIRLLCDMCVLHLFLSLILQDVVQVVCL